MIACLNGHDHPTWADAEACDRSTDLSWATAPVDARPGPGDYRLTVSCPACGADVEHINGTPPSVAHAVAVAACSDCSREWELYVTLRPLGRRRPEATDWKRGRQKLTDDDVEWAVAQVAAGRSQSEVARELGTTPSWVCKLVKGARQAAA